MWIPASAGMTKGGAWEVIGVFEEMAETQAKRRSAPDLIEPRSTPARPVNYLSGFMDSRSQTGVRGQALRE